MAPERFRSLIWRASSGMAAWLAAHWAVALRLWAAVAAAVSTSMATRAGVGWKLARAPPGRAASGRARAAI